MTNLCGIAHTNVFDWLEKDNLLKLANLRQLHSYAITHMSSVSVIKDEDEYWHIIEDDGRVNPFNHWYKEEAQYWSALQEGYFELFLKK